MALALVQTARRLRRYFQAHPIQVVTDQPIRSVLEKPENSGRLAKWAVELGEHITYVPRKAIKAQVLADFIIEVPMQTVTEVNTATPEPSDLEAWKLFTDGASSVEGSGAGLILINPEGLEFTYALRFDFQTTNNEVEYEAQIAGLRLAKEMKVHKLEVFTDSLLVSSQVNNSYIAKEPNMKRYKEKSKELMNTFQMCTIKQIPRSQNKKADALSKFASLTFAHLTKKVLVEVLKAPSIDELEVQDVVTDEGVLVTDNGKQFAEKPFNVWCKEYKINQIFSSVAYPQSNGQVERTNRSIVEDESEQPTPNVSQALEI
ncbi:uncharacterized protein LOC110919551 [Helianthus annuus]|uniref:uncharacterized protein LOC110919551 n=1 Tax=Helianthus annuus TaxID=4232 RepID=UPI000B905E6D|nr:uncharacterized protein LOC110919551 [Helianthus annuus]